MGPTGAVLGLTIASLLLVATLWQSEANAELGEPVSSWAKFPAAPVERKEGGGLRKHVHIKVDTTATRDSFENIYTHKLWGSEGGGSGSGSEGPAVAGAKAILLYVLAVHKVQSMVDAPCGAMVWMPDVLEKHQHSVPNFRYLGLDVVRFVIGNHSQNFASHSNWEFGVLDFTATTIAGDWELIFCRDALQHLPLLSVVAALHRFTLTSAKLLLVGSYEHVPFQENLDVPAGGYYDIDLKKEPFNLRSPLVVFDEGTKAALPDPPAKHLFLYDMEYLRSQNFTAMHERAERMHNRARQLGGELSGELGGGDSVSSAWEAATRK